MRALAGMLWLLAASQGGAAGWRLPLVVATADGCRATARSAALLADVPTAGPDGTIVIDARQPTRAARDPELAPTDDAGLPQATYLRYDLLVPRAGSYTLHAQIASPAGRSRFVEVINGARVAGPHEESHDAGPAPLHWVQRGPVPLRAGLNHVAVTTGGYAFPRFRRLALCPATASPPAGEPDPVTAPVAAAVVETQELRPPGLRRVVGLQGVPTGVGVEWSRDGGRTWAPFAAGEATGALRFRLRLDREQPTVGPLAIEVDVADGALVAARSGDVEWLFDGQTGGLFLIRELAADAVTAGGLAARPWVAVDFKRVGEAVWTRVDAESVTRLTPKERYALGGWDLAAQAPTPQPTRAEAVQATATGATLRWVFTAAELGRARVTATLRALDPGAMGVELRCEVLDGPADVVALSGPRLPAVRLGSDGLDDVQLRLQSFGHRAVQPGREAVRNATYSGAVVMNWTQVYDAVHSLYLGVHDPVGLTTVHSSEPSGPEGEQVGLAVRRLDPIRSGQEATWQTVVAVAGGGWHAGARRYGDWFTATHGPADYPAWVTTSAGWLDLQAENYGREFRFDQLGRWLTWARAAGLDWLQVWGQFAYDGGPCCAAWYGPSPLYGGAAGWRAAAAEARRRGGHLGGYFIYDTMDRLPGRLDTFLGRFGREGYGPEAPWDDPAWQHERLALEDPTGAVPPATPAAAELTTWQERVAEHRRLYDGGQRAPAVQWWQTAWIADPAWRAYLARWVGEVYAGQYGCNTAYLDVLGTGDAALDYDPRRGHHGDGRWGEGRKLLARELLAAGRRHHPDFGLAQEGLGDLPSLSAAALCSGVYRGHRNVFRYTFPDRVLLHGLANQASGDGPFERYLTTFQEALRFDLVGRPTALPLALLGLLQQATPELWQARFVDTEGVAVSDPRLVVRRLVSERGALRGSLLTVTNRERLADARVVLDQSAMGAVPVAFEVGLDGTARAVPLAWRDGRAELTAAAQLASLLLVPAATPGDAAVWPLLTVRRQAPAAVAVTLANLTATAQAGDCRVEVLGYTEPFEDRGRDSLSLAEPVQPYRLAPYAAATVRFPVASLAQHRWTARLRVTVAGQSRVLLVPPLAPDGGFELVEGPGELELGPTTEGYQHRLVDLWLLPGRRYRLSLQASRSGFTAAVSGVLLRLHQAEETRYQDHRWSLDAKRPNTWQALGGEVTTPPDLTRAALYLYNVRSPDTAWFDEVTVDDLGPAPAAGG